jgi:hypothetical protein
MSLAANRVAGVFIRDSQDVSTKKHIPTWWLKNYTVSFT